MQNNIKCKDLQKALNLNSCTDLKSKDDFVKMLVNKFKCDKDKASHLYNKLNKCLCKKGLSKGAIAGIVICIAVVIIVIIVIVLLIIYV